MILIYQKDTQFFDLKGVGRLNLKLLLNTLENFVHGHLIGNDPIDPSLSLKYWLAEVSIFFLFSFLLSFLAVFYLK